MIPIIFETHLSHQSYNTNINESDAVRMNIWLIEGLPNLQTINTVLILAGSICSTPLSVS